MERSERPLIDKWAGFLAHEKLSPKRVSDWMLLIRLCEELAKRGKPKFSPYKERINTRILVVKTAMDLGIDLGSLKYRGKLAMGRGLLDAWNEEYRIRFGSDIGTAGWRESRRRNIKTKVRRPE